MQNTKTLLRRKEEQSEELKAFQSIVKATSVYVIWVQSKPGFKNIAGAVKDFLWRKEMFARKTWEVDEKERGEKNDQLNATWES